MASLDIVGLDWLTLPFFHLRGNPPLTAETSPGSEVSSYKTNTPGSYVLYLGGHMLLAKSTLPTHLLPRAEQMYPASSALHQHYYRAVK